MVNICLPEEELALNIIKDHLGAVAHAVTKALLTREWSSLAQVQARVAEDLSKEFSARPPILTGLSKGQVEDAMLVLIQQNCLDVSLPPTQILTSRAGVPRHVKFMYKVNVMNILRRLRGQRYLEYIKNNYGDVSSAISENLLLNGRLHWCSILKGTVDHLKNEIETQGEESILMDMNGKRVDVDDFDEAIRAHADLLKAEGFIELVPKPIESGAAARAKESEEEFEGKKLTGKRPAISMLGGEETVWRLNVARLDAELRNDMCVHMLKDWMPRWSHLVPDVFRAMVKAWRALEVEDDEVNWETSPRLELAHLKRFLPKRLQADMTAEPDMLRSCLRAMIDDTAKIVSRYHDPELERTSGYVLHMGRIIEHMRLRSLHSILEERYDLESARIVMVLLDKKFLEQSSIGELAMIPAKDTREKLYRMFRDEVVRIQEVPKRSDYNPATTVFLWTAEKKLLQQFVLRNLYVSILSARIRNLHLWESDKELIGNASRITPGAAEADKFNQILRSIDRLEISVHNLDGTLLLWSDA